VAGTTAENIFIWWPWPPHTIWCHQIKIFSAVVLWYQRGSVIIRLSASSQVFAEPCSQLRLHEIHARHYPTLRNVHYRKRRNKKSILNVRKLPDATTTMSRCLAPPPRRGGHADKAESFNKQEALSYRIETGRQQRIS